MTDVVQMDLTTASDVAYWIPELWALKCYQEASGKTLWNRFAGPEGSGMPVIIKNELLTQPGDIIHISQLANISASSGVTGETTLRGNEQQLSPREVQITPNWYRNAVAATLKAEKQITQNFRMKAMTVLSTWMALKMDTTMWTAVRTTSSAGFESSTISVVYGNNATSVNTIDSSDTFGVEEIRRAAATLEANNISKISIPGMPAGDGYYICFIHPYQAYSLKTDSEWIANHQGASVRGATNPLFTGALGEIDGVIIHATTQCTRSENANSPAVYTSRAVMVGQEALCRGMNEDIVWSEQIDDYDFEQGIGIRAAWEDKVLTSNSVVQIVTACQTPGS